LEDALEVTGHLVLEGSDCAKKKSRRGGDDTEQLSKSTLKRLYPNYSKSVIDSLAVVDEAVINYELIAELLKTICTTMEDGAILVFLSGMKGELCTQLATLFPSKYSNLYLSTICHRDHHSDGSNHKD